MQIAIDASKGKIVKIIGAAMNHRNDVFDMKSGEGRIILMQVTILAGILGALTDLDSSPGPNHLRMVRGEMPRLSFENSNEFVRAHEAHVLCLFLFRQLAFRGFPGEFFDAGLKFRFGAKANDRVGLAGKYNLHQWPNAAIECHHFWCGCHRPNLPRRLRFGNATDHGNHVRIVGYEYARHAEIRYPELAFWASAQCGTYATAAESTRMGSWFVFHHVIWGKKMARWIKAIEGGIGRDFCPFDATGRRGIPSLSRFGHHPEFWRFHRTRRTATDAALQLQRFDRKLLILQWRRRESDFNGC